MKAWVGKKTWNFRDLQREQKPWVLHNFGKRPAWMPLLGIFEEHGEYAEAQRPADRGDAIADIVIFTADFCTAMGFDLEDVYQAALRSLQEDDFVPASAAQGRLAHHFLKKAQNIRGEASAHDLGMRNALTRIMRIAHQRADDYGWNLRCLVRATWNEVKKRDWVKERAKTGRAKAETSTKGKRSRSRDASGSPRRAGGGRRSVSASSRASAP